MSKLEATYMRNSLDEHLYDAIQNCLDISEKGTGQEQHVFIDITTKTFKNKAQFPILKYGHNNSWIDLLITWQQVVYNAFNRPEIYIAIHDGLYKANELQQDTMVQIPY